MATELGFDACGVAKAEPLTDEMSHFDAWLSKRYNAGMGYMNNYKDIRSNPALLLENAKSVIVTLTNYYPSELQRKDAPQIAKYAYGKDYHKVLRKRHQALLSKIQEKTDCNGRIFVDSAPILERTWAEKAGLGWIGKSTMLISPTLGSYTFISGIVLDIDLDYDSPIKEQCGACQKCLKACPTSALCRPYTLDANRCLSYLTIEKKGDFKDDINLHNQVFGCDRCIDTCPYNQHPTPHNDNAFLPKKETLEMDNDKWSSMNESQYEDLFNGTAVRRAKYSGLMRNLRTFGRKSQL
jgi:epoxyqueuosine reductase